MLHTQILRTGGSVLIMGFTTKDEKLSSKTSEKDHEIKTNMDKDQEVVKVKIGAEAELPFIEKFFYFCVYSYFFAIATHKIYLFPLGKF